jgi:hypothetical protein
MRAVAVAIGIIVIAVTAMQMGMCQGETACVRECQAAHCTGAHTADVDCSSDEFRVCAKACREAQH